MIDIRLLAAAAGLALVLAASSAGAEPRNLRAFCAAHRTNAGPGENGTENREVIAAGGNTWRCMDGRVWVCNLGASGEACDRTEPYDARRRRAFLEFCAQNPNSDFIPESLSRGLASEWRCIGRRPVATRRIAVDRLGYYRSGWKALR